MAELRTPQGHTLLLPAGGVGIGSDPSNEVQVAAHLGLAAVHFRLQPWEGGHFIEDAGSGLGTLVNGHPVNWKPLAHGDVITAGELEVVYVQQEAAAAGIVPVAVVLPPPVVPVFPPPVATVPPPVRLPSAPAPPGPPTLDQLLPPLKPPAWLPEDLWLEARKTSPETMAALPPAAAQSWEEVAWPVGVLTSPQPFSSFRHPTDPAAPPVTPAPAPVQAPAPRRSLLKRVLAVAASLVLLGGAGHFAWQHGHLARWIPALQQGTQPSSGLPSPPARTPATDASPSAVPPVPAKPPSAVPAGEPRVANQSAP